MTDEFPPFDRPSKTQRKQEVAALQAIGERLLELPAARLAKVEMPDALRSALAEARRINSHEGLRRQLQYIGKLMRGVDPEPLREALAVFDGVSAAANARHQMLERLRERYLDDEATLDEILAHCPGIAVQQLRQLRRNALKERAAQKPPKSYRALFQLLKSASPTDGAATAELDDGEPDATD